MYVRFTIEYPTFLYCELTVKSNFEKVWFAKNNISQYILITVKNVLHLF